MGMAFDFPDELVRLQQEWFAADAARTAAARRGDAEFQAAHRRLQKLTEDLDEGLRPFGASYTARKDLRKAAGRPQRSHQ
jgi:hypothetical protein